MSSSKPQMPGLNIEHRVDGFTVTFEDKHAGLSARAGTHAIGGLIAVLAVSLLAFLFLWTISLHLVLAAFVLGVLVAGPIERSLGRASNIVTRAITIRGGNLVLTGWFFEKRIPLVDVVTFQAQDCLLITNSIHAFRLAPYQPEPVRHALGALLQEAITQRPVGTAADVPDNLKKLRISESLPH